MKWFLLIPLGLALLGIWIVGGAANFSHALTLAGDSPWAPVIAGASACADVLKAAAVLGAVVAFRHRLAMPFLACFIVWGATSGWSIRMAFGFISTISADASFARGAKVKDAAVVQRQLDDKLSALAWLDSSITNQTSGLGEIKKESARDAKKDAISALKSRPAELQADIKRLRKELLDASSIGSDDPVADLLKTEFGVPKDKTHLWTALGFLLLIELCQSFGLTAFSPFFASPPKAAKPVPAETAAEAPTPIVMQPAPAAPVAPKPQLVVDNQPKRSAAATRSALRQHALDFIAHVGVSEIGMQEAQKRYRVWCKGTGTKPLMPWHLGQQLIAAGATRVSSPNGSARYVFPVAVSAAA
jgi:hypothetical protein